MIFVVEVVEFVLLKQFLDYEYDMEREFILNLDHYQL